MAGKPKRREDEPPPKGHIYSRKRTATSFEALQAHQQEQMHHEEIVSGKQSAKAKDKRDTLQAQEAELRKSLVARTTKLPTPDELRQRARERYEQRATGDTVVMPGVEKDNETGDFVVSNVRKAMDKEPGKAPQKTIVKKRAAPPKKEAKTNKEKLLETASLSETAQLAIAEIRARTMRDIPSLAGEVTTLAFNPRKKGWGFTRAIGNLLYNLGYAGEYQILRVWRILRDGANFFGQIFAWFFAIIFGWIVGMVRSIGRDITQPFIRFNRRRKQLRRVRERERRRARRRKEKARGFLGARMRHSFQFAATIVGIVLPILSLSGLLFTVYNVVGMDYGLAVEMNGEMLGYVADQTVVEGAKGLLRDRLKLAEGQDVTDWQMNASYSIGRTNTFSNAQQLANEILLLGTKNPDDLVEATGLYINDELYAVTDRGDELKAFLDSQLQKYREDAPANAQVDFIIEVSCEPDNGDLFFASSVEDYDGLMETLTSNVEDSLYVSADGVEMLSDIAVNNGITLETLLLRNPQYAAMEEDYVPPVGSSILIKRAQPFLQVQTTYRQEVQEVIPFETEERETIDRAKGVRTVVQTGVDGLQVAQYDVVYIDGEFSEQKPVYDLTVVLSEPVTEVIEVGTYVHNSLDPDAGSGAYIWPVPDSVYGSRGMSSYHRGLDINGPVGTPIYAANSGIVVTAGWHYSYGYHVVIEHADGISTLYAHCSSLAVEAGQVVSRGEYIAGMGSTGNSTGSHCHLEFQTSGGGLLNPLDYLAPPAGWSLGYRAA